MHRRPQSQRHRHHWLAGSILQGHTKLNAGDVIGHAQAFSTAKSPETTAVDCGLERNGVRHMLDRLRIASALVAEHQRENVVFDNCEVEADEVVIRKQRVYEIQEDGSKRRTGNIHYSVLVLTQRRSTKQVL